MVIGEWGLSAGSRRKIAVVQAARGGMHAHLGATSHVEAVARALTSLQQCCTQLDFESAPQSSPETEAGGEGKARLISRMQQLTERAPVLYRAFSCSRHWHIGIDA